ncbi:MAG: type II toxin-antitoxin system VapC family toxin [Planctomycetes bacterium]|nr:type II toxin-antitoxin system VapC family toxin [Planctomycetota bacterium]
MFLLDTDHLGILQDRVQPECQRLLARITRFPATAFYVSIVSFHEQIMGWNAYLNRARAITGVVSAYQMFQDILSDFVAMQVLPFDDAAGNQFETLRRQRVRVGTMDLRIASIALVHNFTVLTRNLVDFARVPGLAAEDWARS